MKGMKPVILAIAAALFLKLFVFDFIIAYGHSMEPVIYDGTVLVINRLRYGFRLPRQQGYLIRWAQPAAGDVVVFHTPSGERAVKRCTAFKDERKSFYAEGDNSLASYDSRAYGPVPVDNIIGKVLGY
ncbi:MAG: signal peptidase I [Treponema sp.]|nr:signal peptidase I [Treponema sp.]